MTQSNRPYQDQFLAFAVTLRLLVAFSLAGGSLAIIAANSAVVLSSFTAFFFAKSASFPIFLTYEPWTSLIGVIRLAKLWSDLQSYLPIARFTTLAMFLMVTGVSRP